MISAVTCLQLDGIFPIVPPRYSGNSGFANCKQSLAINLFIDSPFIRVCQMGVYFFLIPTITYII